jgi:hypothetical protein
VVFHTYVTWEINNGSLMATAQRQSHPINMNNNNSIIPVVHILLVDETRSFALWDGHRLNVTEEAAEEKIYTQV